MFVVFFFSLLTLLLFFLTVMFPPLCAILDNRGRGKKSVLSASFKVFVSQGLCTNVYW